MPLVLLPTTVCGMPTYEKAVSKYHGLRDSGSTVLTATPFWIGTSRISPPSPAESKPLNRLQINLPQLITSLCRPHLMRNLVQIYPLRAYIYLFLLRADRSDRLSDFAESCKKVPFGVIDDLAVRTQTAKIWTRIWFFSKITYFI